MNGTEFYMRVRDLLNDHNIKPTGKAFEAIVDILIYNDDIWDAIRDHIKGNQ